MTNKALVFKCLDPNGGPASLARYGELFSMYNRLLQCDNYVLKRQSLKLLSEVGWRVQLALVRIRYEREQLGRE